MSVRCGNCKDNHPTVADVRSCYAIDNEQGAHWSDRFAASPEVTSGAAHIRQAAVAARSGRSDYFERTGGAEPGRVATAARTVVDRDGMYRNPVTGEIWKVQWNRASGDGHRLYAKKLVYSFKGTYLDRPDPGMKTLWDVNRDSVSFEYASGAMRMIRPEWRMSLEQAKEFGALYGTCIKCGRTLTLEESIERSMGPICAGKKDYWA